MMISKKTMMAHWKKQQEPCIGSCKSKLRKLKKSHNDPAGDRTRRMKTHLGLSDEQAEQMKSIREAGGSHEEVRAVLTEEQQAKLDAIKKRHMAE